MTNEEMQKIENLLKAIEEGDPESIFQEAELVKKLINNKQVAWPYPKYFVVICENCQRILDYAEGTCPYCGQEVSYFIKEKNDTTWDMTKRLYPSMAKDKCIFITNTSMASLRNGYLTNIVKYYSNGGIIYVDGKKYKNNDKIAFRADLPAYDIHDRIIKNYFPVFMKLVEAEETKSEPNMKFSISISDFE